MQIKAVSVPLPSVNYEAVYPNKNVPVEMHCCKARGKREAVTPGERRTGDAPISSGKEKKTERFSYCVCRAARRGEEKAAHGTKLEKKTSLRN